MEVPKLFAALGIAILLVVFLNGALSTFYKPPQVDYTDCYSSSSECYNLTYGSAAYTECYERVQLERDQCMKDALASTKTYQNVYFLILALLAIGLLVFGFSTIHNQTVGSGFIGASILLLVFASLFAVISGFASSLLGGFTGMITGFAVSSNGGTSTLAYLNIVFSLIGTVLLVLFSYFKLDNPSQQHYAPQQHYSQEGYH
jgi:hypothetical protein